MADKETVAACRAIAKAGDIRMYEAKALHQFDHRWATYASAADGTLATADVNSAMKEDPAFTVRPRYWVDEREVLACIARVPARVSRAWLALHVAQDGGKQVDVDGALALLLRALAQWVAGELFHSEAGAPPTPAGWAPAQAQPHIAATEAQLKARFPRLIEVLRGEGLTTKKLLAEFPKWAMQTTDVRLADDELAALAEASHANTSAPALLALLGVWMDRRSPRWLMGWRDICRSTDERTVIAAVLPRAATDFTLRVNLGRTDAPGTACLLGEFNSLCFDFVARQKVGGTHMADFIMKQLPVLPPERYSSVTMDFIVPRVFELTYTANDLKPWAEDLATYDPRPAAERGQPFAWNPARRAQLRAELDAYYARLYGLTRDELRYILDPKEVMGEDYPSETFRVLKEGELRSFGEYRTRRLVLEAWDQLSALPLQGAPAALGVPVQYSGHGMIRTPEESKLAGLIVALVAQEANGCSVPEIQSLVAGLATAEHYLDPVDGQRLAGLRNALRSASSAQLLTRILPIVQRLEEVDVLARHSYGGEARFMRDAGALPGDVIQLTEHADLARLLWRVEARRRASESPGSDAKAAAPRATGTQ